jgi:hypothetical protein
MTHLSFSDLFGQVKYSDQLFSAALPTFHSAIKKNTPCSEKRKHQRFHWHTVISYCLQNPGNRVQDFPPRSRSERSQHSSLNEQRVRSASTGTLDYGFRTASETISMKREYSISGVPRCRLRARPCARAAGLRRVPESCFGPAP